MNETFVFDNLFFSDEAACQRHLCQQRCTFNDNNYSQWDSNTLVEIDKFSAGRKSITEIVVSLVKTPLLT